MCYYTPFHIVHWHSLLMFLPFHVFSSILFKGTLLFSQQVWRLKPVSLEITASFSNLTIAESTGLYKHFPYGVCICDCSPNASKGRFSLCYALYEQRRINVSFGKPALCCSQIFLSLVSVWPSPILSLSLSFPLSDGYRLQWRILSDLCRNSLH